LRGVLKCFFRLCLGWFLSAQEALSMLMDLLREFWALMVAAFSVVVWAVRLEAKSLGNARDIRSLKDQRGEDLVAARLAREDTSKRLDEILADVRQTNKDIKDILGRLPR